jgi:hypothetical protein
MHGNLVETATLDCETLPDQFDLRNENRVNQYLRQHSFLLPFILEAKAQITRLFSPETGTALEVSVDPSDGSSQL